MKNYLTVLLLLGSLPAYAGGTNSETHVDSPMTYNVGYMSDYWYRGYFNLNQQLISVQIMKTTICTSEHGW